MSILQIREIGTSTWYDMQDPSSYTWDIYDLDGEDGAGRTQNGTMSRDRIAIKRKLNLSFPPLTMPQMSALLNQVSSQFFEVKYPDAKDGAKRTGVFYVGDRSVPAYTLADGKELWNNFSMNFIER